MEICASSKFYRFERQKDKLYGDWYELYDQRHPSKDGSFCGALFENGALSALLNAESYVKMKMPKDTGKENILCPKNRHYELSALGVSSHGKLNIKFRDREDSTFSKSGYIAMSPYRVSKNIKPELREKYDLILQSIMYNEFGAQYLDELQEFYNNENRLFVYARQQQDSYFAMRDFYIGDVTRNRGESIEEFNQDRETALQAMAEYHANLTIIQQKLYNTKDKYSDYTIERNKLRSALFVDKAEQLGQKDFNKYNEYYYDSYDRKADIEKHRIATIRAYAKKLKHSDSILQRD